MAKNWKFSSHLPNHSLWDDGLPHFSKSSGLNNLPSKLDVAIVGAGFTGLWTAYYLKRQQPSLRIAIFEAHRVAFGASGRNGGWAVGSVWGQDGRLTGSRPDQRTATQSALYDAVDEIGSVAREEDIRCGYHKGGMLRIAARDELQLIKLEKLLHNFEEEHAPSRPPLKLDSRQTSELVNVRNPLGSVFMPDCAVLNPAALALGLAESIAAMDVPIIENCPVTAIKGQTLEAGGKQFQADFIVPATEGYSTTISELGNRIIPVYSFVVATERLSSSQWAEIGLHDRQAFSDCSGASTYGQRTADGRIVFGALGSYLFGNNLSPASSRFEGQLKFTERLLRDLFPQLQSTKITHRWAGALGVSRKFSPTLVHDRSRGLIWGGGYAGRGVTATNLFGRTMADIILGNASSRVTLPWVKDASEFENEFARWEPEPLRWIGTLCSLRPDELAEHVIMSSWAPLWAKMAAVKAAKSIVQAVS